MLMRIFGPKRDEATGECCIMRSFITYRPCSSQSIIRMTKSRTMRWAGHVARMGEKMNAYRILVGTPEGKSPLRRPRRMRMDLREIGSGSMDWIDLAQDRDQ
jgi:hypothetical protein